MKVSLNIENDEELRLYVKDLIKGQVLSIVRDELYEMIKQELDRKTKALGDSNFNKIFSDSMVKAIGNILEEKYNVTGWGSNWLKPIISSIVEQHIKRNSTLIDQLAKEKVRLLLQ